MSTIKEILSVLEEMAPLAYAEDYDNVGLIVGDENAKATGILVCHDALEQVVEEAIAKNCNLIVCFHPILFSGLKRITGKNYVERALLRAIKNDIAIYALHTAMDNHPEGVNKIFCDALGIENAQILIPKQNLIRKLVTYTIRDNAEKVRNALFEAGAGSIGNYDKCSFNSEGTFTYQGNEKSEPTIGQKGVLSRGTEVKIEVVYAKHLEAQIIKALRENHIYEEVACEIYNMKNNFKHVGLGMIGELKEAQDEKTFLEFVKEKMGAQGIRHSAFTGKKVKKVAVLGGSGSFAIANAKQAGADVFLTSDLKYHQYFEAENQLLLADIGHFESERYTKDYIVDYLRKKILNFAIILSEENTNPVKYL